MNLPSSSGSVLFSSLPSWKVPRSEFLISYGLQAAIAAVFFWVPVLTPQVEQRTRDYLSIALVATPVSEIHEAQKPLPKPLLAAKLERLVPPPVIRLGAPRVGAIVPNADSSAPEIEVSTRKIDAMPKLSEPSIPRQVVRTNLFSSGSSAPQTIERPAQRVQTGGFGDPNGVPAKVTQTQAVNIAQAGGFDLPNGPGVGNGSGGAIGVRGVVASAGFGSGTAIAAARSEPTTGVREAGFGTSEVAVSSSGPMPTQEPAIARTTPAEILSKPAPVYTDEARAKRIEGEVLLEVVFEASGKLRVLKVVHGLGHGLDDSAVHAAEQIRFKPALRNGQPSDSTAVVHIIFQLA